MNKQWIDNARMTQDRKFFDALRRHLWVVGTPGSGYESVCNELKRIIGRDDYYYAALPLFGTRGSSWHPSRWSANMDMMMWYMFEYHKPVTAFFGVADNSNKLATLFWSKIVVLHADYDTLYNRIQQYAIDHQLPTDQNVIQKKTEHLFHYYEHFLLDLFSANEKTANNPIDVIRTDEMNVSEIATAILAEMNHVKEERLTDELFELHDGVTASPDHGITFKMLSRQRLDADGNALISYSKAEFMKSMNEV